MKKILYLIQLPPPLHGASLINQKVVSSEIINQHKRIFIIPIQLSSALSQLGKFSLQKIQQFFSGIQKLLTQCLFNKPDIVYLSLNVTGKALYRDLFFVAIVKFFRIKLIYHLHGKGILQQSDKRFYKFLYQFIFNNSQVIFVSPLLENGEFQKLVLKNTTIYNAENGIDQLPDHFIFKKTKREQFTFLFLSNLAPTKGIYILLDAFKVLTYCHDRIFLNIVGGDFSIQETRHIKQYAKSLSLCELIQFHGALSGEKKYEQLRQADCFVHPTLNDSFGLVILEAMQFELPVIATIEGGIPHIIVNNKTGLLVEKNNVQDLSDKMSYIISHPDKASQMGKEGRKRFLSHYTTEHFENRMKTVFDAINTRFY